MTSRRSILKTLAASPLLGLPYSNSWANPIDTLSLPKITRSIPKTGENIAAIGMGTYQTFDVENDSAKLPILKEIMHIFFEAGGQLVDSSPMYGNSEVILGKVLSQAVNKQNLFSASKVWTYGKKQGMQAVAETQRRMQQKKMDLMQVHNLRDWQIHLPTLRDLKAAGKIRHIGITTSSIGQYQDFEQVMKSQELDFIQVNYNIAVTEAAERIIPLAKDMGIAVIVNMPFEKGRLFSQVKGTNLPEWSKEFDCHSWGQFFLKYIVSLPDVTCAIPATSKLKHMKDNMLAMRGNLPDQKTRIRMKEMFDTVK